MGGNQPCQNRKWKDSEAGESRTTLRTRTPARPLCDGRSARLSHHGFPGPAGCRQDNKVRGALPHVVATVPPPPPFTTPFTRRMTSSSHREPKKGWNPGGRKVKPT